MGAPRCVGYNPGIERNASMEIPRKDTSALKQLVRDYLVGQVFFSAQLRDTSLLGMVFMPLIFGGLAFEEKAPETPPEPKRPEKLGWRRPVRPEPDLKDVTPVLDSAVTKAQLSLDDVEFKIRWGEATGEDMAAARKTLEDARGARERAMAAANKVADAKHLEAMAEYRKIIIAHRKVVAAWRETHQTWRAQMDAMADQINAWEARRDTHNQYIKDNLGVIYAYMKDAIGSRAINGYPMFGSCSLLHKDDWDIVRKAIDREMARDIDLDVG